MGGTFPPVVCLRAELAGVGGFFSFLVIFVCAYTRVYVPVLTDCWASCISEHGQGLLSCRIIPFSKE